MTEKPISGFKLVLLVCGILFTLLLVIALFLPSQSKALSSAYRVQSMSRMKNILQGIVNYRANHNEAWPDTLDDIHEDLYSPLEELIENPYTHDNPGYEYVKPRKDADPATTAVLFQLRDGKQDLSLEAGYGDGRVLPYRAQ